MRVIKRSFVFIWVLTLLMACVLPVSASEGKKLYFEEHSGKMTWNNVRGSDGNWFMSFTNMVPGGDYEDNLQIENGSNKSYKLYVQVIPKQQDKQRDDLLELISMEVSLDQKTIYEGSASGKEYENGNLQKVIYLGTYEPKEKSQIAVKLKLDKDVGLEYCDVLTENDWKFMVTEVKHQKKPPQEIQPPQTGDSFDGAIYIALGAATLMLLIGVVRRKRSN